MHRSRLDERWAHVRLRQVWQWGGLFVLAMLIPVTGVIGEALLSTSAHASAARVLQVGLASTALGAVMLALGLRGMVGSVRLARPEPAGLPSRERFFVELEAHIAAMPEGAFLSVCAIRCCNLDSASASLSAEEVRHVLRTQARRLDVLCGGPWPVGRLRDDTLAFAVPNTRDLQSLLGVAATAVEALSAEIAVTGGAFTPRVSAGLALWPDDASEPEHLVEHALAALAVSTQRGPRSCELYSKATQVRVRTALDLERALKTAIQEKQLHLVYQPLVKASTGAVIGAEALVRWRHPELGNIPPSVFIPIAERSALVTAIDRFVLDEAGRRTMVWRRELGIPDLFVSVNLSTIQFRDPHLVGWIARHLRTAGVDPEAVVLEVTETAALHDVEHGSRVVRQLRELGVRVALDDFGTGHSWLSYLSRLDIDRIKIDQAFVRNVHENPRQRAICEAVAALGRGLSLRVVAEGVESAEEAELLTGLGIDDLQGYYFAGPLTAERFAAYTHQSRPSAPAPVPAVGRLRAARPALRETSRCPEPPILMP